jgi:hypothetical protein
LPTLKRVNTIAMLSLAAGIPMLLAGCKGKPVPVPVDLAPGYSGPVVITCALSRNDFHRITVDSTGHGQMAPCPQHPVDLVIERDGKPISSVGPISWDSTGDGITVGFHFSVH